MRSSADEMSVTVLILVYSRSPVPETCVIGGPAFDHSGEVVGAAYILVDPVLRLPPPDLVHGHDGTPSHAGPVQSANPRMSSSIGRTSSIVVAKPMFSAEDGDAAAGSIPTR